MHSQRTVPWEKWLPWAGRRCARAGRPRPWICPACLWPLSTNAIGRILHVVDLCRPVLREVPGLGRSVGRAALVVRSVKLVHQPIESGEAGMCSWLMLPVSDPRRSCSARFCRSVEPPFHSACPLPGACSITRWFTLRRPFSGDVPFLPLKQPLAQAREVAYWHPVMQRRNRVRPDSNDRSAENSSPPLSARARLARRPKWLSCRSQAHHCPRP